MLLNNLHFYAVIRRRKDECPFFGTCASPKMGPTHVFDCLGMGAFRVEELGC